MTTGYVTYADAPLAASLWRRMLHRWGGSLPFRLIEAETDEARKSDAATWAPLFERYHVCSLPGWLGGGEVYLHHYLRSDPDRGMHDHPWAWAIAIPLAGGYVEERMAGFDAGGPRKVYRERRSLRPYRLTGHDFHRVTLPTGRATSWSLFITARNVKGWGFLRGSITVAADYDRPVIWCDTTWRFISHSEEKGSHTRWWFTASKGRLNARAPA